MTDRRQQPRMDAGEIDRHTPASAPSKPMTAPATGCRVGRRRRRSSEAPLIALAGGIAAGAARRAAAAHASEAELLRPGRATG